MYSFLTVRQRVFVLIPAIVSSIVAGSVAPLMTRVVGQVFDAFARSDLSSISLYVIQLVGLGCASILLSSITSLLWISTAELNLRSLKLTIYHSTLSSPHPTNNTFAKEMDEIRAASSLASGFLIQHITTSIAALSLAFYRSYSLSLVILSSLPILIILQSFSQSFASPLISQERALSLKASNSIDTALSAIDTVKAFNAQSIELARAMSSFRALQLSSSRLARIWGLTSASAHFVMMAMFVQAFWYGAKLVRDHKNSPGEIMAVFWACLIATTNLQMCIPRWVVYTKGKFAFNHLLSLSLSPPSLRKISPSRCIGELALHNLSFSYSPHSTTLSNLSLFLPANDLTFLVGSSGSGKSTVAQLLLGFQSPLPGNGHVTIDDQDLRFLDDAWLRENIMLIGQPIGDSTHCILFPNKSIFDNIALALSPDPSSVSYPRVVEACRAAMLHEFIIDLPDGYHSILGSEDGAVGIQLSGGQKQRLMLARARLRNPPVLILDEATSALDPPTRILVFSALRRWRANKTTIVISHQLSEIEPQDFVYVLKDGSVVEQGFRADLEQDGGEFRRMLGYTPIITEQDIVPPPPSETVLPLRPLSWMFDAIAQLTVPELAFLPPVSSRPPLPPLQLSSPRPSSAMFPDTPLTITTMSRRFSAPGQTPTSATFTFVEEMDVEEMEFEKEKNVVARSGTVVHERRRKRSIKVVDESDESLPPPPPPAAATAPPSFFRIAFQILPMIPSKPLFVFALLLCTLSGLMTPVFSYFLSRLLYQVSLGGLNTKLINQFGGILLLVCAFDGLFLGAKYVLMERISMGWVTRMRERALERLLMQDRAWFDGYVGGEPHSYTIQSLVQTLIKDADDARSLISIVYGQTFVVFTMLTTGLVWALVLGWQLTLAGLAIAPVFAVVMSFQSKFSARSERRNKVAREGVSKAYYDALKHVFAVRAVGGAGFRVAYERAFEGSVDRAMAVGVRGAVVEGSGFGVAGGMIYFAEAGLFYVGAELMKRGVFGYLRMVEVLNLVVFSVTIGSQMMAFTEKISKSTQASSSLLALSSLPTDQSSESKGSLRLPHLSLPITFSNITFSYPSRPSQPVLRNFNLRIEPGEVVAIVGSSGCGKSTVVGLLERLWEPNEGAIWVGETRKLGEIDVRSLRNKLAVVSQAPTLFDTSVTENIRYGTTNGITDGDVRTAAKRANVHEVVMGLGDGYDTVLGTTGGGLSGGQAQRVQIARALARMGDGADVLILDEGTSALDGENEGVVLDAVRALVSPPSKGKKPTVLMVTHKLEVMRLCDRIVVLGSGREAGRVVEQGRFEDLMEMKGEFSRLASGGVWEC